MIFTNGIQMKRSNGGRFQIFVGGCDWQMIERAELKKHSPVGCYLLYEHLLNVGCGVTAFNDSTHIDSLILLTDDKSISVWQHVKAVHGNVVAISATQCIDSIHR